MKAFLCNSAALLWRLLFVHTSGDPSRYLQSCATFEKSLVTSGPRKNVRNSCLIDCVWNQQVRSAARASGLCKIFWWRKGYCCYRLLALSNDNQEIVCLAITLNVYHFNDSFFYWQYRANSRYNKFIWLCFTSPDGTIKAYILSLFAFFVEYKRHIFVFINFIRQ